MIDRNAAVDTFKSICTEDAFRVAVAGYVEEGRKSTPSPAIAAFVKEAVRPAIAEIFRALSASGTMPKLPDSAGHRIELVNAWEAVTQGSFDTTWGSVDGNLHEIADKFTSAWGAMQVLNCAHDVRDGAELGAAVKRHFGNLLDRVRDGGVQMWEARECYDFVDDERYRLEFEDWVPSLVRYDPATNKNVGIKPLVLPLSQTLEVEFETGNLLIADWFRMEGFDEEFGPDDYSKPSVNSKIGREMETQRHGQHGVIHVYVGGSSPFVFSVDGELVIGNAEFDVDASDGPDIAGADLLGRTSTSLRWVTIVEREQLVGILVRNTGCAHAEAAAKVEAYAEEYGVVSATVAPGKRTLHYSGDHHAFADGFHSDDLPLPADLQPYFVVSSRPLTLSEKPPIVSPAPGI